MPPPMYEIAVRLLVALVAVFLFAAVAVAYRRRPGGRMALVLVAFGIFVLQGGILAVEAFLVDSPVTETTFYVLQLAALFTLALAAVKRT